MVYTEEHDLTQLKIGDPSIKDNLLNRYYEYTSRWLDSTYSEEADKDAVLNRIETDPKYAYYLWLMIKNRTIQHLDENKKLEDLAKSMVLEWDENTRKFKPRSGFLCIIVGNKGHGKSTLALILASIISKYKKIWWYGTEIKLPPFIKGYSLNINDIPSDSFIIVEEAGMQFSSRKYAQNDQDFIDKLTTLRHNGKSMFVISQNTSLADVNFLRLADAIIYCSKFTFKIARERLIMNEYFTEFYPVKKGHALYYDNKKLMEIKFKIPKWWKNEYSISFANFKNDAERYRFMINLSEEDNESIKKMLLNRGYEISDLELLKFKNFVKFYDKKKLLSFDNESLERLINLANDESAIGHPIKGASYNFKTTSANEKSWEIEEGKKPEILIFKDIPYRKYFEKDIDHYIRNVHINITIQGGVGSGKSYACLSLAEYSKKRIEAITGKKIEIHFPFTPEELLKTVESSKEHDIICYTEAGVKEFGIGSGRAEKNINNLVQTMRLNKIHFIWAAPIEIDKLSEYILITYGIDYINKITKLIVFDNKKNVLGFITLKIPSEEILNQYNKKDIKFKTETKELKTSSKSYKVEFAQRLAKEPNFINARSVKEREMVANQMEYLNRFAGSEKKEISDMAKMIMDGRFAVN